MRPRRRAAALFVVLGLTLASCKMSCFAPAAKQIDSPIASILTGTATGTETFDHRRFDALLRSHSRPLEGRIDYAGMQRDAAALAEYTATLAAVDLSTLTRNDQKALLLNAYNAFTLQLILEGYPEIQSIKDLPSPWKTRRFKLAGEVVSLDDIEHGLLRPIFRDPRIHFAVNCASVGCPPLADFAFKGPALESQLDLVAAAALRNERYAARVGDTLRLTSILNWYGDDFVAAGWAPRADSLPAFVAKYADASLAAWIAERGAQTPIEFADYDWGLNDIDR